MLPPPPQPVLLEYNPDEESLESVTQKFVERLRFDSQGNYDQQQQQQRQHYGQRVSHWLRYGAYQAAQQRALFVSDMNTTFDTPATASQRQRAMDVAMRDALATNVAQSDPLASMSASVLLLRKHIDDALNPRTKKQKAQAAATAAAAKRCIAEGARDGSLVVSTSAAEACAAAAAVEASQSSSADHYGDEDDAEDDEDEADQFGGVPTFILNLWNNPWRLEHMREQCRRGGLRRAQRFAAVDAKQLPQAVVQAVLADGAVVSNSELGTALAHAAVWRHVVKEGLPFALVLQVRGAPLKAPGTPAEQTDRVPGGAGGAGGCDGVCSVFLSSTFVTFVAARECGVGTASEFASQLRSVVAVSGKGARV